MLMFRSWQQLVPRVSFSLALFSSLIVAQAQAGMPSTGPVPAQSEIQQDGGNNRVFLPLVLTNRVTALLRIDAGSDISYTDQAGNIWEADTVCDGRSNNHGDIPIANTSDPQIYRTERFRVTSCPIVVPNGNYQVRLHFAEIFYTRSGQRVFDVDVEGARIENLDVLAEVPRGTALVKTVDVTVADGLLDINFSPSPNEGLINGIEVFSR